MPRPVVPVKKPAALPSSQPRVVDVYERAADAILNADFILGG